MVVRSDGARKRSALRYKLGKPVPKSFFHRDVPEFDRLRREREREILRRRREQKRLHGEGSSSAAPAAPPPEGYDPEYFGTTLGPEDFIPDEQLERTLAATLLRSKHEAAEHAATAKRDEELDEVLLQQTLVISCLPPVIDLVSDEE